MEKEKAKRKTTQMKVVRKDGKIRKPQSADSNVEEVIYSDSDVEEATIFGSIPPSALEVDKNGISASLLGSSTLQQESTSSLTYYCPQLLVEEPLKLEGEGTHNLVENQSFLALMLD
ncbi:hypothetical protein MKW92_021372 [Papaver armeniacum]|nr:hypothetical protein MKW92_021372 [Papaver armeniacum]